MKHDTPHPPDDELDDLFRRAAGAYQPPFDPTAWKQMQRKLDGGTRPMVRRLYLFAVIELLFVLAGLLLIWNGPETSAVGEPGRQRSGVVATEPWSGRLEEKSPESPDLSGPSASAGRSSAPAQPLPTARTPERQTRLRPATDPAGAVHDRPDAGTPNEESVAGRSARPAARLQPIPGATPPDQPLRGRRSGAKISQNTVAQTGRPARLRPTAGTRQNLWRTSAEKPESRRVFRETEVAAADPAPLLSPTVFPHSVSRLPLHSPRWSSFSGVLPNVSVPAVSAVTIDLPRPRLARWSALVLAAPDFTNVPGRALGKTGYNLGVQLEFRPLRRLRLGLGALYATKLYDASSYDYRPPYPGYWQRWGRPDRIEADCRILEIPLSIRYDVLQRERSALSVSVGSSSYLMLNEHYFYRFPSGYEHNEYARRSGNHWLATMNFAVGYERTVARQLALRVESFLKLPRGGVGKGDVRLRTAGVAVGLRYDFPRR